MRYIGRAHPMRAGWPSTATSRGSRTLRMYAVVPTVVPRRFFKLWTRSRLVMSCRTNPSPP